MTKHLIIASVLALALAAPVAYAQSNTDFPGMPVQSSPSSKIAQAKAKADQEITRRVTALNAMLTRIEGMKRVSASEQATFEASLNTQITAMNALEAQIGNDTATTSLRSDIQSITKSYRIFALILPQTSIAAAADRVLDVASQLSALAGKLATRLGSLSGSSIASLQATLSDMTAKITDAQNQANAAVTEIASLVPDQGNQTVMQSNTAALKDARSKIQVGQADLKAARADAGVIIKALVAMSPPRTASTTGQ